MSDRTDNWSTIVGAIILCAIIVVGAFLTLSAMRAIDSSYEDFSSFLNGSVRVLLKEGESEDQLSQLGERVRAFIDRVDRIASKSGIGEGRLELGPLRSGARGSVPLDAGDRAAIVGAIERLEIRIADQRGSIRSSFNALFTAINVALVASLMYGARLWYKLRVGGIEARWTHESLKRALYAEEETKGRISRDLHDDALQDIAAARMLCERAASPRGSEGAAGYAVQAAGILSEASRKIRRVARELRPSDLEQSGLVPALESLCARAASVYGKEISFSADGALPRLSDDAALQSFRIVQEAVNNSVKHARGDRLALRVDAATRGGREGLFILIEDELSPGGRLRPAAESGEEPGDGTGLGMSIMKERAAFIGAHIEIGEREAGISLCLFVPADSRNRSEDRA